MNIKITYIKKQERIFLENFKTNDQRNILVLQKDTFKDLIDMNDLKECDKSFFKN